MKTCMHHRAKRCGYLGMALLLAAALALPAAAHAINQDEKTGKTDVTATVEDPNAPSYTVEIPAKIDFGTFAKPTSNQPEEVSVSFNVGVTAVSNLGAQKVAVRVHDTANRQTFMLAASRTPANVLEYDIEHSGASIKANDYVIPGGYQLFAASMVTTISYDAVLDKAQLFEKDESYNDAYTGTLTFYAQLVTS
ncbi:hypothetical protein [Raoultibacter phocaeensis]|uniref:hypothetical protein n=1 Tax=Raoultibacter phocaeensis TaxID=2479841 RepID=UPI00111B6124|nr:hypothetical protein [Raoultibacter phocaeensis]